MNINDDWWDFSYENFKETLSTIGITCERFYFSLDRDYYIAMDKPSIENHGLFFKAIINHSKDGQLERIERSNWMSDVVNNEIICNLSIKTNHYSGGRTSNYIDCYYGRSGELTDKITDAAEELLKDTLNDFLSSLNKEFDYLTSAEAIEETIEANDYDFLENGKRF